MTASMAERFAALGSEQRVHLLRRLVEAGRLREIPAIVPRRTDDRPVRLSPAQEDLWVYQSLYPGTPALNLCVAYHLDATAVDVADLERALTILHEQHDILRLRIAGAVGDLRMEFPPPAPVTVERLDLRRTATTLAEALTAFSRRPFELDGSTPLLRGQYLTVDDTRATLVLALHHIATDWWSFDVLHTEFVEAYQAVRAGVPPRRRRPEIQYADFAAWQRELEESGVFDAQLDFWRRYLGDPPTPMTVGGAGAWLAEPTAGHGIEQVRFRVHPRTEAAARAFARARGTTVYGVLMTAFAVFAHRLTDRADFVLGTPTANRSAKGLERLIGYVMNAVPTRWRIGPDESFASLLGRFTVDFPAVLANGDVPVGRIVSAVDPERVPGRSPLFQWVFMHLTRQDSVRRLREIAEPERIHTGGEHDLVGITRDTDEGIIGMLEARRDVYPPELVRRWAASFGVLLTGLLARPDIPVDAVDLLPAAEQRRLLVEVNDTAADLRPASIVDLMARQAVRTPSAVAVESDQESLSYAELIDRVDRLAGVLRAYGVRAERIVALVLGRSVPMVVAALAVQRAGGAYLPIDPDYPADRIRYLLDDAAPVLVVTDAENAASLPETEIPVLVPETGAGEPLDEVGPGHPRQAGYVIYTSGSTGRPKGVVVSHAGIPSLTDGWVRRFGLSAGSRVLLHGSPSFDMSVGQMCMAFGSGGTLIVPPTGPLAGDALGAVLRERRISCALLPPAVLATVAPGAYPDLRAVCLGGDACPAELVAAWTAPDRQVFNAYGPTETTVGPTVSDPLPPAAATPPIGRPIRNARVYVLDGRLRPVPVGVPGELYVGGAGVARGYLGLPGQTAQRFVADPYAPRSGARMYRTGDLVRWRGDDQLDFLGRADEQVALRGFRIEPAEIEAVLAGHETVAQAVVVVREDSPGDRRLVAYLVPRPGHVLDEPALLAHALAALPVFMVPAVFVPLAALPTTEHGKVDRAALPAPGGSRRPGPGTPRQPRSTRETVLCRLYAEVLGIPEVGPDDGFFELGGDSILAILLARRAHAAGLGLTLRQIFTARTPAALATLIGSTVDTVGDAGQGRFPLTPVMHWWREQAGPLDTFAMSMRIPVPAGLDPGRVSAALRSLVDRHGALRLRLLRHTPDDWELDVPPAGTGIELSRVDTAGLPDAEVRAAAVEAAARARLAPEAGRVTAAVWFDAGPDRPGQLLLTVHHLAVDAVSWHILRSELAELLATGGLTGPPPGTSLRRWAELLPGYAGAAVDEFPLWEGMLSGPEARLVADGRPAGGRRETYTSTVDVELAGGHQEVLLTALLLAAIRWRGRGTGLLVHLDGHGREAPADDVDVSRTVGWFTTLYPVRLDAGGAAAGGADAARALARVKQQLRAVPAGGLGYGLLRYLNPDTEPKLAELPGPDVRFNYLGRFGGADAGDAELLGVVAEDAMPLAHALELDVVAESATRLVATWSYAPGMLAAGDVQALAGYWAEALGVLAGSPPGPEFDLVDLTPDEIDALAADLDGPEWGGAR